MRQYGPMLLLIPLSLWLPMAFTWGWRSASIRLGVLLLMVWYGVGLWDAYPAAHDTVVGWLVVAVAVVVVPRLRGGGGRGRRGRGVGVGRGRGGAGGGPGGAPLPFHVGGRTPTVVVVADRGLRAGRGVFRRLGRTQRRLERAAGNAVGNVAEGRLPWRGRAALGYVTVGSWFEGLARVRRRVTVDGLRDDVAGQVGVDSAPTFVPEWMLSEREAETERLRRDVDGRPGRWGWVPPDQNGGG